MSMALAGLLGATQGYGQAIVGEEQKRLESLTKEGERAFKMRIAEIQAGHAMKRETVRGEIEMAKQTARDRAAMEREQVSQTREDARQARKQKIDTGKTRNAQTQKIKVPAGQDDYGKQLFEERLLERQQDGAWVDVTPSAANAAISPTGANPGQEIPEEDIEYTARKWGMEAQRVREMLGVN